MSSASFFVCDMILKSEEKKFQLLNSSVHFTYCKYRSIKVVQPSSQEENPFKRITLGQKYILIVNFVMYLERQKLGFFPTTILVIISFA